MNQLQVFNHSMFGELPVLVVGDVEWFGGTESAKALGFSKPHDALANHVDEEDSAVHVVLTSGGRQNKKFINESGLYSLIFGAAKQGNNQEIREKAKQFKRWVTAEVLPTIRKTGGYVASDDLFIDTYLPFADEIRKQFPMEYTPERLKWMAFEEIEEAQKGLRCQKIMAADYWFSDRNLCRSQTLSKGHLYCIHSFSVLSMLF